jgi:hypothetical protein
VAALLRQFDACVDALGGAFIGEIGGIVVNYRPFSTTALLTTPVTTRLDANDADPGI